MAHLPSLHQEPITDSYPTWCPPGPPRHFLLSCFASGLLPAYIGAWDCSSSDPEFPEFPDTPFWLLRSLWMAAWPSGYDISHFSQIGVTCKFSEGTLIHHPYCYEDAEQDRMQYWPLRYTGGHWHPTRLGLLITTIWPQQIQPIFKLLHCFLIHQQLLYGAVIGESVTGTSVVQVENSLCSHHVHQASHSNIKEIYQVGNTRLPTSQAMLNAPHGLLVFNDSGLAATTPLSRSKSGWPALGPPSCPSWR